MLFKGYAIVCNYVLSLKKSEIFFKNFYRVLQPSFKFNVFQLFQIESKLLFIPHYKKLNTV